MQQEAMKELLFSLAWFDASAYHSENVVNILEREFPDCDFAEDLQKFEECVTAPPGPGCPR